MGLVIVIVIGVIVTQQRQPPASAALPTLAVLPSLTPSPVITTTSSPAATTAAVSSPVVETTSVLALNTQTLPTILPETFIPTLPPTSAAVSPAAVINVPTSANLPTSPVTTPVLTVTSPAPTQAQTPTPGTPPPTAVPPPNAAALNLPVDTGVGQMRVVAVTRPGSSLIQELGGSAPNPPAGQVWVVVEILLVCADSNQNCAPNLNSLSVTGSSGKTYPPAADFFVEPLFGPSAYNLGQVWGYSGFIVPNSEAQLYLLLNHNGQTSAFALQ